MEEVVGSIPTRSTKFLNKLDGASAYRLDDCVVVCVVPPAAHLNLQRVGIGCIVHAVTRLPCAYGEGFHRFASFLT